MHRSYLILLLDWCKLSIVGTPSADTSLTKGGGGLFLLRSVMVVTHHMRELRELVGDVILNFIG